MKKLLFTLVIILGCSSVIVAQETGKFWVGGSVGFSSTSVKDGDDYFNFKILPEFGYVINDRIGVGLIVGYQQTELDMAALFTDSSYEPQKIQGFIVNPFARISILKGNLGGIFVDGGFAYSHSKNKDYDVKTDAFEVGFRPGIAFNVSEQIALTAKFGFLGYEYLQQKHDPSDSKVEMNTFGLDLDLSSMLFGINFVF